MDTQAILMDIGKLVLATLIGAAIGFEREAHGQAAGFRTYLIVSIASCLMMMLSLHMEELYRNLAVDKSVVRLDPGRLASYAIVSMGFLGAGAIIKGKGSVRGLTTAAGLWSVTGIGLAIGAGYIIPSFITSVIIIVSLYFAPPMRALSHRRIFTLLTVKAVTSEGLLARVKGILAEHQSISLQFVNYNRDITSNTVTYRLRLHHGNENPKHWSDIVKRLSSMPEMKEVTWEESDVP